MISYDAGDADCAGRANRLQSGGDVDALTVQVAPVRDSVADIDAHTEADTAIGRIVAVAVRRAALHVHGKPHGRNDAVERDQKTVPADAYQGPAVPREGGVDQVAAQLSKALEGASLIEADQAAVSGHVGIDDSDQFAPWSGSTATD